jgi:hypothetical protein
VDQLYETGGCHVGATFFFGQFCDVAKWQSAAGRFSQIWLKEKYESKIFLTTSFHISGYLLDQCIEIWRIFLKFFSSNYGN